MDWLIDAIRERFPGARVVEQEATLLAESHAEVIVADARLCSRAFLDSISSSKPRARVLFVATDESVDKLIHAISTSHSLSVVHADSGADGILTQVEHILAPRTEVRHRCSGLALEASDPGGERVRFPLWDISNRGLAFETDADALKGWLLPGTPLDHLRVVRADGIVLDGAAGVVRHLVSSEPDVSGLTRYRVGVELWAPSHSFARDREVIDQQLELLSLLESARLDRVRLSLSFPYETMEPWTTTIVATHRDHSTFSVAPSGPRPVLVGDVLRLGLEMGGVGYQGFASIKNVAFGTTGSPNAIELRFPNALAVVRRRRVGRFVPDSTSPVRVTVVSPFNANEIIAHATDLTPAGLSFLLDEVHQLMPVGTVIPKLHIAFARGTTVETSGIVRSLTPRRDGRHQSRCGVQFLGISADARARIADEIVAASQPRVRDATGLSFDELWVFLEECGFLYAEKRKALDEVALRHTFSSLLSKHNDAAKTFVCLQDGKLLGHQSVVRTYPATCTIQHLATVGSAGASSYGRLLNLAIAEYFQQRDDIEWFKMFYRPENRWPDRIIGTFARRLGDSEHTDFRIFDYLVRAAGDSGFDADATGYAVRPAAASDLGYLESCFLKSARSVDLKAQAISWSHLSLGGVDVVYESVGLSRRREAYVVERNGKCGGAALLEISSPGLNLSELTSAFSIFSLDDDPVALRILAEFAPRRYAQAGRRQAICLTESAPVRRACEAAGFVKRKDYAAWTFHRTVYAAFHRYALRRFG